MKRLCPNCGREADSIKSIISKGEIITGCNRCLSNLQKGSDRSSKYYRQEQQRQFKREITQPFEPREYIKAYPEDARKRYGDDFTRKNSI